MPLRTVHSVGARNFHLGAITRVSGRHTSPPSGFQRRSSGGRCGGRSLQTLCAEFDYRNDQNLKISTIHRLILDPQFLRGGEPKHFTAVYYRVLSPTMWQSLVEFCRLKCVCESRQWRKTQNFRRVGKNSAPTFSRKWTKVHEILRQCSRPFVVSNAVSRLSISCSSPEILAPKVAIELRSRRK